jgi:hypothetical protein
MRPMAIAPPSRGVQVFCFLLLSHLEPDFFPFISSKPRFTWRFLSSSTQDRWAYRIGMLAPAAWLVMAFATGCLARRFASFSASAREPV